MIDKALATKLNTINNAIDHLSKDKIGVSIGERGGRTFSIAPKDGSSAPITFKLNDLVQHMKGLINSAISEKKELSLNDKRKIVQLLDAIQATGEATLGKVGLLQKILTKIRSILGSTRGNAAKLIRELKEETYGTKFEKHKKGELVELPEVAHKESAKEVTPAKRKKGESPKRPSGERKMVPGRTKQQEPTAGAAKVEADQPLPTEKQSGKGGGLTRIEPATFADFSKFKPAEVSNLPTEFTIEPEKPPKLPVKAPLTAPNPTPHHPPPSTSTTAPELPPRAGPHPRFELPKESPGPAFAARVDFAAVYRENAKSMGEVFSDAKQAEKLLETAAKLAKVNHLKENLAKLKASVQKDGKIAFSQEKGAQVINERFMRDLIGKETFNPDTYKFKQQKPSGITGKITSLVAGQTRLLTAVPDLS